MIQGVPWFVQNLRDSGVEVNIRTSDKERAGKERIQRYIDSSNVPGLEISAYNTSFIIETPKRNYCIKVGRSTGNYEHLLWAQKKFENIAKQSNKFKIPKILHHDPSDNSIVFEYIDGKNLRILDNESKLKLMKEPIRKVAAAIKDVHTLGNGLVHGDFKNVNVIYGDDKKVYLIDFDFTIEDHPFRDISTFLEQGYRINHPSEQHFLECYFDSEEKIKEYKQWERDFFGTHRFIALRQKLKPSWYYEMCPNQTKHRDITLAHMKKQRKKLSA
jgi:serine/threonine protein kinase